MGWKWNRNYIRAVILVWTNMSPRFRSTWETVNQGKFSKGGRGALHKPRAGDWMWSMSWRPWARAREDSLNSSFICCFAWWAGSTAWVCVSRRVSFWVVNLPLVHFRGLWGDRQQRGIKQFRILSLTYSFCNWKLSGRCDILNILLRARYELFSDTGLLRIPGGYWTHCQISAPI